MSQATIPGLIVSAPRSGAGKTAFLANVLFGLAARYGPDQLAIQLVDLGPGEAFAEYLQTEGDRSWLPHVRAAGMEADREYLLAVLDELEAELDRRVAACEKYGVSRFAQLRAHTELPRLLCVIENFPLLLAPADRLSAVAVERLAGLAQRCRMHGIHLVLAGNGPMAGGTGPRDPLLGQFPVRVALPGGAMVLEQMIHHQASQIGFNEIFHLLGILFLVVIAFVWFARPPFAAKMGKAAAAGECGIADVGFDGLVVHSIGHVSSLVALHNIVRRTRFQAVCSHLQH